jgi:hypothetical protein
MTVVLIVSRSRHSHGLYDLVLALHGVPPFVSVEPIFNAYGRVGGRRGSDGGSPRAAAAAWSEGAVGE